MSKLCVFDVETKPADNRQLFRPEFQPPANYRDPEKIKANLIEQEQAWNDQAALSPLTGEILCIGVRIDYTRSLERVAVKVKTKLLCVVEELPESGCATDSEVWFPSEATLLQAFWNLWIEHSGDSKMVGFAVMHFDLPFLIRRSYALGVKVPHSVLAMTKYKHEPVIDLQEAWSLWTQDRISLNNLAKFLGVGEKNGNGKDFAELYAKDRKAALLYLENDLTLTAKIYERLYL